MKFTSSDWFNFSLVAMLVALGSGQYDKSIVNLDSDGIAAIIDESVPNYADQDIVDIIDKSVVYTEQDIVCMTDNVYHEARGESGIGQRAVVDVVLNRITDPKHRWPRDVCSVIYQPWAFSWTMGEATVNDFGTWMTIKLRVKVWMENHDKGVVDANHYHTVDISPSWNNNMKKQGVIGAHAFFKDI